MLFAKSVQRRESCSEPNNGNAVGGASELAVPLENRKRTYTSSEGMVLGAFAVVEAFVKSSKTIEEA